MLPNTIIDAKVEGNLGGETVKMEIDHTATAHLMSVLTDLYSDRITAFIREYATNARDAHIEAGTDRPIKVTLPSRMSHYYRIRDYGIGLDIEGIRNIYSKYGASTKRGSNDFNGMLGLGCKSAMTYAAQFSIISVKDGMKYNVAVSRGSDGVGEMEVLPSEPTDEGNGVEIVIPIKSGDLWSVAEKAAYFFQWWDEGTVLVNGSKPKRFVGRNIADNLYMVDGLQNDLIVMGNVPYPVPFEEGIYSGSKDNYGYNRKNFGVVYFAEMGEVTFAPSRESLQTTKNTKAAVEKARELFKANLKKSIQAEFDALDSHIAALKHRRTLAQRYYGMEFGDFMYRGEDIPTTDFEAPYKMVDRVLTAYEIQRGAKPSQVKEYDNFFWYDANGGSAETRLEHLGLERLERNHSNMVILVNAPKMLTVTHKTKIRRAYDNGDLPKVYVLATSQPTKPGGKWTDGIDVLDWSVIRDFKVTSNTVSDNTKHTVHEIDGTMNNRTVPDMEKVVYQSPTWFNNDSCHGPKTGTFIKYLNEAGYTFILLNANRHAKFKREHPNSLSLESAVRAIVADYEKSLDADARVLLGIENGDVERLVALKGVDIADKAVVDLINKVDAAKHRVAMALRHNHSNRARHFGIPFKEIKAAHPFADYPLVGCLSSSEVSSHKGHVAEYIKAVIDSKKGM